MQGSVWKFELFVIQSCKATTNQSFPPSPDGCRSQLAGENAHPQWRRSGQEDKSCRLNRPREILRPKNRTPGTLAGRAHTILFDPCKAQPKVHIRCRQKYEERGVYLTIGTICDAFRWPHDQSSLLNCLQVFNCLEPLSHALCASWRRQVDRLRQWGREIGAQSLHGESPDHLCMQRNRQEPFTCAALCSEESCPFCLFCFFLVTFFLFSFKLLVELRTRVFPRLLSPVSSQRLKTPHLILSSAGLARVSPP